jgi:diguanylate cyclase (GGDEF)-like protein/PAS domain S-box-containing protein
MQHFDAKARDDASEVSARKLLSLEGHTHIALAQALAENKRLTGLLETAQEADPQHIRLRSRRQSEAMLDGLPEMAWCAHADGRHDYANRAWHEFTGIARDASDAAAETIALIHSEDRAKFLEAWEHSQALGAASETLFRMMSKSGKYRWVLGRVKPEVDDQGIVTRWFGTCTDMHECVLAEEDYNRHRNLLQTVIDSVSDLVFVKNAAGQFILANRALEEGCGMLAGRHVPDQFRAELKQLYSDVDEKVIATGQARDVEEVIPIRGEDRLFQTIKVPWISNGEIQGVIGVSRDITERQSAHDAQLAVAERLRSTLDAIPQMVWAMSADGNDHYYNEQWVEFTGVRLNDAPDTRLSLVHPDDCNSATAAWEAALLTGEDYDCEYRLRHHSGDYRWVHSRARAEPGGDAGGLAWYGVVSDIHDRKCAELALHESEALHRSILEASDDCIKLIGIDGRLEMMNQPGACAMEIDDLDHVLGREWVALWPAAARRTARAAVEAARSGRAARFTDCCPTAKGTVKWWDVVITPMTNEAGEVTRLLCISRDITAVRKATDQLRWTSEHDGLTDLPNRRSFQAHLQASTLRAMESGGSVGLLLIDLDHFKHVNDTLGHAAGDHLLRTFGQRLKNSVRGSDFVARLGGDEFAVIMERINAHDDILRAGESILDRLQDPITFEGRMISAGASIGGAAFPSDANSAHELFKSADTALYALKGSGRGGTRMFHNYMREEAQKVASQLSLARVAICEKSVVPHYQQKVNLRTGRICGFEALLRWHHPGRGMQMPDTVAEAFKDYELASKIGHLMQSKVFSDIRAWERSGVRFGTVSINASPAEFLRDDYGEKLLRRLEEYQVPGSQVEIEVTEHVFLDRGAQYVRRALHVLKEAGVSLSLDDFGTGYSSLSHLRDFPVDIVKIDRSFIAKMVDEPEIASIVSAVIDLAKSLSLEVVAEGIETVQQRDHLRAKNCSLGQGYLFGRAVVADEVPILLAR